MHISPKPYGGHQSTWAVEKQRSHSIQGKGCAEYKSVDMQGQVTVTWQNQMQVLAIIGCSPCYKTHQNASPIALLRDAGLQTDSVAELMLLYIYAFKVKITSVGA